ncbi:MAG: helix-turn-helix domain-containing protein, partial [Campylobacterales bacterium]|nr:helix-turn-helix domain-containing protein [Campylobacterales bacterium]
MFLCYLDFKSLNILLLDLFMLKFLQNYKVIKMINEEIKKLRKSLNLSQEDFGSILGVAQRTVSAWEAG